MLTTMFGWTIISANVCIHSSQIPIFKKAHLQKAELKYVLHHIWRRSTTSKERSSLWAKRLLFHSCTLGWMDGFVCLPVDLFRLSICNMVSNSAKYQPLSLVLLQTTIQTSLQHTLPALPISAESEKVALVLFVPLFWVLLLPRPQLHLRHQTSSSCFWNCLHRFHSCAYMSSLHLGSRGLLMICNP